MALRRKTTIALLALTVGTGATVVGLLSRGAESAPSATVSATGKRVKLTSAQALRLRRSGYGEVYLLATRGGRALYRVRAADGRTCYGVGSAATLGKLGQIGCWRHSLPLMDFSAFEITRDSNEARVIRVEGIAADGIATVGITRTGGSVLGQTEVFHNVYHFDFVPQGGVDGLVGFDTSGNAVGTLRFGSS